MHAKVYWCARDLASAPVGNHHFVLITVESPHLVPTVELQSEGSVRFGTLGGFAVDAKQGQRMLFRPNDLNDVRSVREVLDPGKYRRWYRSDFDLERHRIAAPETGDLIFAQRLCRLARNYERNESQNQVTYSLSNANCATWVNSLFAAAGVPKEERLRQGEFFGVDWGEEQDLAEDLFAATSPVKK